MLAIFVMWFVSLTLAHGEKNHNLEGQKLCVDQSSVQISFHLIKQSLATQAQTNMVEDLQQSIRAILSHSNTDVEFLSSCKDSDAFVLLLVRITYLDALDSEIHAKYNYGKEAYGYSKSLMVGKYEDTNYFENHHVLPELKFMAFKEESFSEQRDKINFDQYIIDQAPGLLTTLAESWLEDNCVLWC